MSKKYQTLHSHTTASDGELSHLELLDCAARNNVRVLAFTDHDGLPDGNGMKLLESNRTHSTKWVIGIEISSGLPVELGGGVSSGLHIVGLFVDPFNTSLLEHCKKAQEARIVRMQKIVANLQKIGFDISEEECLKASGGEAVGRPHIVQALVSRSSNLLVIEKLRMQMERASGKDSLVKERYENMMRLGERQYPYALFLGNEAFISDVYVEYQYWTDMDTSVSLIRNAGGVAILAHYHTIQTKITPELLDKFLAEDRLDGAETLFGFHAVGTEIEEEMTKNRKLVKDLVLKNKKLESGGADAHTETDIINFSQTDRYAKDSIGMVEKIIESNKVDQRWASV